MINGEITFREMAEQTHREAFWLKWAEQQTLLMIELDLMWTAAFQGSPYDRPIQIDTDHPYPSSISVGDRLRCHVGRWPSLLEVVDKPTRKKVRLRVIEGPRPNHEFTWTRDLMLPFYHG